MIKTLHEYIKCTSICVHYYFDHFTKYTTLWAVLQHSRSTHHSSILYIFKRMTWFFLHKSMQKKKNHSSLNEAKCYISVIILNVSHVPTFIHILKAMNSMHVVCFNHSMILSVFYNNLSLFSFFSLYTITGPSTI